MQLYVEGGGVKKSRRSTLADIYFAPHTRIWLAMPMGSGFIDEVFAYVILKGPTVVQLEGR